MLIVVMDYGKDMNKAKLEDVLDNTELGNDKVVAKMNILLATMEATNPNIDDPELRWVEHKIEQLKVDVKPTKNDLLTANLYWNK